ncbi:MAG: TolC family protein [Campylobacterota bacterium]
MKRLVKKVLQVSLVATTLLTSATALNLKEAVDLALKNNHSLKAKNFDYEKSMKNVDLEESSYLPKVDVEYNYNKRDNALPNQLKEDGTLSANVTYNLFNGFKDVSNIKSSEYLSKSSRFLLDALRFDIVLETKKAYINYLDKFNLLKTYKSEYLLFKNQYKDAKSRYEQGLLAKNDLLEVQVNMSSAKQNIVKAKAALKVAKLQLSNIIGGVDLLDENIEALNVTDIKRLDYKSLDFENRSEIKALKMSIESIVKQKDAARGSYYPKLDAKLSHNEYYDNLGLSKIDEDVDNQNIATLNASWNLYNGGADLTKIAMLNTDLLKLKTQLQETKLNIKLQYEDAKAAFEVATDNLITAKLALSQAKENYSIVQNRFKEGVSTSTDLIDANFLLSSAKQKYNRAYFDKFLAIATLNRIFEID